MTVPRLLAAMLLFTFLACSRRPEVCWACQREIAPRVRVALTLRSGRQVFACCPRCALHYGREGPEPLRAIEVSDYAAGGTLPMRQAFLVEGSDETPCLRHHPVADERGTPLQVCYDRCMPSLIAFRTESAARVFVADRGGKVYPPGSFPDLPADPGSPEPAPSDC